MRTKFMLTATVFAIVLGVLTAGSAVASAKGGGKQTLKITGKEKQSDFLDLGRPGPSLGDEFVLSEELFRHGRDVGASGVVCTVTRTVPPYDVQTFHCVATLRLRNGQITLQGLIDVQGQDDPGPFRVAITGGTGAFRDAGGDAVIRGVNATTMVYTLRIDSRGKAGARTKHHTRH